ncbi:hypothetical protein GVE31_000331 [Neisseria gonorrhoeae]
MSRPVPAVFGSVFHSQMPVLAYREGKWQPTEWQSSQDLTLAPGAHALHYGSECFEGLKAFRQADGKIVLFRPTANIARMRQSADILHLPRPETQAYLDALVELVKRAADEIPDAPAALYLRPTLIGTDPVIGKAGSPSETALLYILASPVGDYFKVGSPVKILVETEHIRCAPHRQGRFSFRNRPAVYFGFPRRRLFQSRLARENLGGNRTHPLRPAYGPRQMRRQLRFRHALVAEGESRIRRKSSPVLPERRRSGNRRIQLYPD